MALTVTTWVVMGVISASLLGVGTWAIVRSLSDEERKLRLVRDQGRIDTYSPKALRELREWVEANPNDSLAAEGRKRHNECVDALREIDEPFYDWSDEEIESLERI